MFELKNRKALIFPPEWTIFQNLTLIAHFDIYNYLRQVHPFKLTSVFLYHQITIKVILLSMLTLLHDFQFFEMANMFLKNLKVSLFMVFNLRSFK